MQGITRMVAGGAVVLALAGWVRLNPAAQEVTWQYECREADTPIQNNRTARMLREMGSGGWELVGVTGQPNNGNILYCFKKPVAYGATG